MADSNGVAMSSKPQYQFNGVNSNNSSRGASPVPRAGHIPASQLPPMRGSIPSSQLPPSRSMASTVSQKMEQLSVSDHNTPMSVTPNISPYKFSTSTPNQQRPQKSVFSENPSPVVPSVVPNSLENVPLNDNATSDLVNKNVTLTQENNEDTLKNKPLISENKFPASSTSQYFSQGSSFDTHLKAPQNQNVLSRSTPPVQQNQVYSTNGPYQATGITQISQSQSNFGMSTPSSLSSQQASVGLSASQNSLPQHAHQNMNSAFQGNLYSQSGSLFQKPPLPPVTSQGIVPPLSNTLPPRNPNLQYHPPASQSSFTTVQAYTDKEHLLQGNVPGAVQNPPPYSAYPTQVVNNQNKPVFTPPISSMPPTTGHSATQASVSSQSQTLRSIQQPSTQAHFPQSLGHAPRPKYPQSLPPAPAQSQGILQNSQTHGYSSNMPNMPSRMSPYNQPLPEQSTAPLNAPPASSFPKAPPPSQRFDPKINYNIGTSVSSSSVLPPANQANFGPPPTINGPSLPNTTQNQTRQGISAQRYPQPQQQQQQVPLNQGGYASQQQGQYPQSGVVQSGFGKLWGQQQLDLLSLPNILPPTKVQPPLVNLGQDALNAANCSPEVFCCTMTKIPESASLLQKSRLPLGLLIHPFKDLSYLPVIQCNVIVRCRACRTYINPFVLFVDSKRWKCNLCYRVNELPEEFQYDPVSKTYGDPSRRPEIKSSTIEYIAPAEYMLRPPQPAVYLFLLDVSRLAIESGYLEVLCGVILEELKNLPGDARTQIGFIAYDSFLHFFSLAEGLSQPHEMTVLDIEDVFLPTPDNLLVNLKDRMEMIEDLLNLLPKRFGNTFDGNSALGAALQVAHKMMGATGGRVTVFQCSLPNIGPGAVTSREDPNQRSSVEVGHLNPANDFYKRLALECSGQQIAVDMFILNSQYVDIATISGISRFSGGCIQHFPLFKSSRSVLVDGFQKSLRRYLTRKIGFEAVMRVRCTRGLSIHTFHGNFFVRSTDLLSLPNINPDAAFGMQVSIEESLSDCQSVCFQAALLYTSSKGERRIRVHTLCLPIATTLSDVINSADQQCIIGLLGKMAVDRSLQSSLSDAREAFINAVIDVLSAYKFSLNMGNGASGLLVPECLKLLPLYISAILKHPAFRIGMSTRLDDRVKAMLDMKTKPLYLLMQSIYPDLYPVHNLENQEVVLNGEEEPVPMPPRLQLSARCLENKGAFLLDCGDQMIILVGPNVPQDFLNNGLGSTSYGAIPEVMSEIPILENTANQRLHQFINYLNDEKPYPVPIQVIRDNSPSRGVFYERLIEDRLENSLSYHEFLQHLKMQVK